MPIQYEVYDFGIGFQQGQQAVHHLDQLQAELLEVRHHLRSQCTCETWCSVRMQAECLQELFQNLGRIPNELRAALFKSVL